MFVYCRQRKLEEDGVTEDYVGDCLQVGGNQEDGQEECKYEAGNTLDAE